MRSSALELRPIEYRFGSLAHIDGSASFSFGAELVTLAGVRGPSEVRIRDELTDKGTLEILFQPLGSPAALPATSLAASLRSLFSGIIRLGVYPRTLVQIHLQTCSVPLEPHRPPTEEENDKLLPPHPDAPISAPEKSALINASMAGLIDAGVECRATVTSVSLACLPRRKAKELRENRRAWRAGEVDVTKEDDEMDEGDEYMILLDPTPAELRWATSDHVFAFAFSGGSPQSPGQVLAELVFAESSGRTEWSKHKEVTSLAREAAQSVLSVLRQTCRKNATER
ncbi:Exosomal 3'-5' exoribonuclease complex, subunit Rrp46 [Ceraceosorus bombacis]|uniref:Exosomal 3'-5' exoribonuclease complex, subunit Rrp46 n=1 Tax=Ceraceosorus bombacis TaxID=401625 RepID=A0A0P1BIN8_9BASI|nr:Exosomal 3'-5' exoribonuclease complex, subunit Rrp46 [Ceraceosorus bombacis]